jgi:RHS repeat-associated protein
MDRGPLDRSQGTRSSFVGRAVARDEGTEGPEDSLVPRVELPRGGGALRGIGETFEANAFTGTGTLTLPVPLSPARAMTPSLELSYDSGRGNGPFGLGFELSVPEISRRTDRGLPLYGDGRKRETDTFVRAGAEDLVRVLEEGQDGPQRVTHDAGTHQVIVYRPRVQSEFSRIERWVSKTDASVHWRVTSRDNVTSFFGETPEARVSDPKNERKVFRWLLERQVDDRGNEIHYVYKQENLDDVNVAALPEKQRLIQQSEQPQRYLKRVLYGNRVTDPEDESDFAFEVVLDYGEHGEETGTDRVDITPDEGVDPWPARLDTFSSFRSGFDIRTRRLCRRILVFHRFEALSGENAPPRLVRSLDLEHDERPNVTLLVGATQRGYLYDEGTGHYDVESMPPVTFGYTARELSQTLADVPSDAVADIGGAVGGRVRLVDLNAEGIPGLLVEGHSSLIYKPPAGDGRFHPARPLPSRPTVSGRGPGSVRLMDIDGSGRMSVVQRRKELPSGFWRRDAVAEDWEEFRSFAEVPTIPFDDPHVHFVDLDGDGIADFLYDQGKRWLWWASAKDKGWGRDYVAGVSMDEDAGPQMIYNDSQRAVLFADMTGDGLSDVVMVSNGRVCYWPNLGYGRFGRKVTMSGSPWFEEPDQFHTRWLRVVDVDGTGPADLVYFDGEGARVWFNEAGNGFAEPVRLSQFPAPHTMAHMEVADLLGKGTACLLWSSPLPAQRSMRYVDLFPGGKPYLLNQVDNGMGLERRVHYGSSTEHYLRDRAAGRPWATRLPFPVQVIDRIKVIDHARGHRMVSTYAYHHGYFDAPEREFRGFGMVEQRDTESFEHFGETEAFSTGWEVVDEALHAPPAVTKTWFHTGAYLTRGDLMRQYETEYWQGDENASDPLVTKLPNGLRGDERREALRALRGRPLRQEVYAEDGSDREGNPYQVTEHAYALRSDQEKFPRDPEKLEEGRHHGVFFVHDLETRSFHYERDPEDPRFVQSLVLAVDDYGNVERTAEVAYPRRTPAGPAQDEQSEAKVVIAETDWVNQDDPMDAPYRLGTPVETRSFELTGFAPPNAESPWTAEQVDTMVGSATTIDFEEEPTGTPPHLRLIGRTQIRYWNDALTAALPHGEAGTRALVHETWTMAFTGAQIVDVLTGRLEGTALTDALTDEGRYVSHESAWWTRSELATFDDGQFYLRVTVADPFENPTTIVYDEARLLVIQVTDAVGNEVHAEHDYRTLQPELLTDPNGNRSFAAYDGLGRVTAVAIAGKDGETDPERQGDTLANPTQWFEYHPFEWQNEATPVFVHAYAREQYFPVDSDPPIQQSVTYTDGGGNVLMEKVLAEPGLAPERDQNGELVFDNGELLYADTAPDPRWVGTGRTVLDNKGNPVKQYEPFFSDRPDWETEAELVHFGVTPILHYDPLGRLIRTDHPDGTLERVVFTPWHTEAWDRNDTVLESEWYTERDALGSAPEEEKRAAVLAEAHANTPTVTHTDVLGRDVVVVAHLRDDEDPPNDVFLETRTTLDISGNVLEVVDARENIAQTTVHGMLGQGLHTNSPDAGDRWTLGDVAGAPLRLFDGLDRTHRFQYDDLRRPTHHWVQPDGGSEALVLLNVWGETAADPEDENLRGQLIRQYDGAGLVESGRFHFAGHLLEQSRTLATTYDAVPDWVDLANETTLGDLDTVAATNELLETQTFANETTFDALGRPVERTTPDGSVTRYAYNVGGLLESVEADVRGVTPATTFVQGIEYDVYGRRASVEHGNGTTTAYDYDPQSFRVRRIHTTRTTGASPVQDLRYTYDPVGNVVEVRDEAIETVYFANDVVEPEQLFEYDALYRLVRAEGREHTSQNQPTHSELTPGPQPDPNDPAALRRYVEEYTYDEVGNLIEIDHDAINGNGNGDWTRGYDYHAGTNRLRRSSISGDDPGDPDTYSALYDHDAHGNMTAMPHLEAIEWDHADRMQHAGIDGNGSGDVYFQYDAEGNRVRKVWVNEHRSAANERIYLGGLELYRERAVANDQLSTINLERETLHIADDTGRIAMVETRTIAGGQEVSSPANVARYQYGNHLGTVSLELDENAAVISYEEYHPFGTSAYRAVDSTIEVSAKRYRYAAAERDEETGLDHMGLRYYAPWLGRWTSADPIGLGDGVNRYAYVHGNPVSMRDPGGTEAEPFKVGETITREQVEQWRSDTSVGEEGAFPVVLPGGENYFVLPGSSVETLPGVSSGLEGHTAWQFKEGSTAKFELQKAEALEANRIAAETSAEWGAGRILASKKMIQGFVVVGGAISLGVIAAGAIAPTTFAGTVGTGTVTGAGEGGLIASGLTLLEGGSPGEALQASKTGAVYGGLAGAVGSAAAFGLARGFGALGRPPTEALATTALRAPPGGQVLRNLADAEVETAVGAATTSQPLTQLPVKAAGEELARVSRWGQPGLRPNDWVMKGEATFTNYVLSGKMQPRWMPGRNVPAPLRSGETFDVPKSFLGFPTAEGGKLNPLNWLKYALGQRQIRL